MGHVLQTPIDGGRTGGRRSALAWAQLLADDIARLAWTGAVRSSARRVSVALVLLVGAVLSTASPAQAQFADPTFSKAFAPSTVTLGATSVLTFTIDNTASIIPATLLNFTDNLPAGIQIAPVPNASTNCTMGTITAPPNGAAIAFIDGEVADGAICTISVTVVSTQVGSHLNTTSQLTLSAGGPVAPATATLTVVEEPVTEDPVPQTSEVIRNFLIQRADRITIDDPLLTAHLNGVGVGLDDPGPLKMIAKPGGSQVAFATSLSRLVRAREAQKTAKRPELPEAMAFGGPQVADPTVDPAPTFDIWVRGHAERYQDTAGNVDEDGTFGMLYVGGEYRAAPDLLVGMLVQFDWIEEEDDRTRIETEGTGWMVGPYVVGKLTQQVFYQARAAWGQSDNDVTPFGTYTDGFDADRWLASAKVEGRYWHGPWRVSPIAGIIYFEEEQERYVDALGNTIPGQTVSLGRLTFGPQLAYAYPWGEGHHLEIYGEVTGVWDFDVEDRVVAGIATGTEELRAKLSGGMILRGQNGIRFEAAGFVDGIGANDFEAYGGKAKVRVPLN